MKEAQLQHVTEGPDCWCALEILQICPACPEEPTEGCSLCDGRGVVPITREAYDRICVLSDGAFIFLHDDRKPLTIC